MRAVVLRGLGEVAVENANCLRLPEVRPDILERGHATLRMSIRQHLHHHYPLKPQPVQPSRHGIAVVERLGLCNSWLRVNGPNRPGQPTA